MSFDSPGTNHDSPELSENSLSVVQSVSSDPLTDPQSDQQQGVSVKGE